MWLRCRARAAVAVRRLRIYPLGMELDRRERRRLVWLWILRMGF